MDEWAFVAVCFDQFAATAKLFVSGQSLSTNATAMGLGRGSLIVGSISQMSLMGSVRDLFAYGSFLDDDSLRFLFNFHQEPSLLPVAGNAGYALSLGNGFSLTVPDSGLLGGFDAFTLAFWYRVEESLPPGEVFLVNKSSYLGLEYAISVTEIAYIGERYYSVFLGDLNGKSSTALVTRTIPSGSHWCHVTAQWDGTQLFFLLNSTLLGNTTWRSSRLPSLSAPLTLGSPEGSSIAFDSFALWNVSFSYSNITSLYSFPRSYDPNLLIFFAFNEGAGVVCSSPGGWIGYITPLYESSSRSLAGSTWIYSGAPIDNYVQLTQDGAAVVVLNASRAGDDPILIEIVQLPKYGVLAVSNFSFCCSPIISPAVARRDRKLSEGDILMSQSIEYVPNEGYFGNDSLSYAVVSGGLRSKIAQVVLVVASSASKAVPLRLSDSTLFLEQFSIWDKDSWEKNIPLNVDVALEEVNQGVHSSFSLASTIGLNFDQNNAIGVGEDVTEAIFYADPPHANDAIGVLQLHFPDSYTNVAKLHVSASDTFQNSPTDAAATVAVTLSAIPVISEVIPCVVTALSDVDISIYGYSFDDDVSLCKIGDFVVPAILFNPYTVVCRLPYIAPDTYLLRLLTRKGIASNSLIFSVVPQLQILQALPSAISSRGDAVVSLALAENMSVIDIFCVFDMKFYEGNVISPNTVICHAPEIQNSNLTVISLAVNTHEISSNSVILQVSPAPIVYWLDCTTVVATSHYLQHLKLFGIRMKFEGNVSCALAGYHSLYTAISEHEASCVVPMNDALRGFFLLSLFLNGHEIIPTELYVRFIGPPQIQSLSPSFVPTFGESVIHVIGLFFDSTLEMMCAFGSMLVPSFVVNETLLLCQAPHVDQEQQVFFTLATLNSTLTAESFPFIFFDIPVFFSLTPTIVPLDGGYDIFISGENFLNVGSHLCSWDCNGNVTYSSASVLSETTMTCTSPLSTKSGICALSITIDNELYSYTVRNLTLFERPLLDSITPTSGPIEGGYAIRLFGEFLYGAETVCSFNGVIMLAAFINSTTIECTAPPAQSVHSLSVNLVVVNWPYENHASRAVTFSFYDPVIISRIAPSGGSLLRPTKIYLYGTGFLDYGTAVCALNTYSTVKASVVSRTEVTCMLPLIQNKTGDLDVSVSLNGVNFSPPVKFWVWPVAVISSVAPTIAVANSNVVFSISGYNFRDSGFVSCTFNESIITPIISSPNYLSCRIELQGPGKHLLGVSRDDGLSVDSAATIEVIDAIIIEDVSPLIIFEFSMANVTLFLTGGIPTGISPLCKFVLGMEVVRYNASINGSSAVCTVFGLGAGFYSIEIELDNVTLSSSSVIRLQVSKGFGVVDLQPRRLLLDKNQSLYIDWVDGPSISLNTSVLVRIGGDYSSCLVYNHTSVRCSVAPMSSGLQAVHMSINEQTFQQVGFIMVVPERSMSMMPLSGPTTGYTRVIIIGGNFDPFSSYECRLGDSAVRAEYITSMELRCFTPAVLSASSVNLTLLIDSVAMISSTFTYYEQPILESPSNNSVYSIGELLTVRYTFNGGAVQYCFINDEAIVAGDSSINEILCRAPPHTGPALIDIAPNGETPSGWPITIMVVEQPVVKEFYPSSGSTRGGMNVTLVGSSLSHVAFCVFGATLAAALPLSDNEIVCIAPPSDIIGSVPLKVSVNGVNLLLTKFAFSFVQSIVLESVMPIMGPESGGSMIKIRGVGLYTGPVWCVFDGTRVPGSLLVGGTVSCLTAASPPGIVSLSLMTNGDEISENSLSFSFYPLPTIVRLIPSKCQRGRICVVLAIGANFIDSSTLSVMVGGIVVSGVYINSTALEFFAPDNNEGQKMIKISNNGEDFTTTVALLSYLSPILLEVLPSPDIGPVSGGTPINFKLNGSFSKPNCLILGRIVSAVPLGGSIFECQTPPSPVATSSVIEIRDEDLLLYNFHYFYYSDPVIKDIHPHSHGDLGGQVSVIGEGFLPSGNLSCLFGRERISAFFKSSRQISCQAPAVSSLGYVTFQVSLNGYDFTAAREPFEYTGYATISNIIPDMVASSGGVITIYGTSFVVGICCVIDSAMIPASIVFNSTAVSCVVPSTFNSYLLIDVSNNCVGVSGSPKAVKVIDRPQVLGLSVYFGPLSGGTVVSALLSTVEDIRYDIMIGSTRVLATQFNDSLEWIAPMQVLSGNYPILISAGSLPFTPTNFAFNYFDEPFLTSIEPSRGSEGGGTAIYLFGGNLGPMFSTYCVFGSMDYVQVANYLSPSILSCISPPHSPGVVRLRLSFDLQHVSASFQEYVYNIAAAVYAVEPSALYAGFGKIQITGANFINSSQLSCCISGVFYSAMYISDESIICYVSLNYASDVAVAASNNGIDISYTSAMLTVLAPFTIVEVFPTTLVNMHDWKFSVEGNGFDVKLNYKCVFNRVHSTDAFVISGSLVSCPLPTLGVQDDVLFEMEFSLSSGTLTVHYATPITFVSLPPVSNVVPIIGPDVGGWKLTIEFGRIIPERVNFTLGFNGGQISSGTVFGQYLSCIMPSLPLGESIVELSINDGNFHTISNVSIMAEVAGLSASPNFSYTEGNQTIWIIGSGFTFDTPLCCEFDGVLQPATVQNLTTVTCVAPPHEVGRVGVRVIICDAYASNTRNSFSWSYFMLYYIPREVVYGHYPTSGFLSGSNVTFGGIGFDTSKIYLCGYYSNQSYSPTNVGRGLVISSTALECMLPALMEGSMAYNFTLHVLTNTSTNILVYQINPLVVNSPLILSTSPTSGTELGGTEFVISGKYWNGLTSPTCKFGGVQVSGMAIFDSVEFDGIWSIVCATPEHEPGEVSISVSANGVEFLRTGFSFKFLPIPQVSEAYPLILSDHTSNVTFSGSYFDSGDQITCVFGNEASSIVEFSASVAICKVPKSWNSIPQMFNATIGLNLNAKPLYRTNVLKLSNPSVYRYSPSNGPVSGGTTVIIMGDRFVNYTSASCTFGSISVPAFYVDSLSIGCSTPFINELFSGAYQRFIFSLSFSNDHEYYTLGTFTYYKIPIINYVFPPLAFENELGVLLLQGSVFFNSTLSLCRLQHHAYPLVVMAKSRAYCVIERLPVGTYGLEISFNGQNFEVIRNYSLTIIPLLQIEAYSPQFSFLGYLSLSINVTLVDIPQLFVTTNVSLICSLNGTFYPAAFYGRTVECLLNGISLLGTHYLDILLAATGQSIIAITPPVTFIKPPNASLLRPSVLFMDMSSPVVISGIADSGFDCAFAFVSSPHTFVKTTPTARRYLEVVCEFPTSLNISKNFGTDSILVGLVFSDSRPWFLSTLRYISPFTVYEFYPWAIFDRQQLNITVFGNGFAILTPSAVCRIGLNSFQTMVINQSTLICLNVTIEKIGSYTLEVAGFQLSRASPDLRLQVLPIPSSILVPGGQLICQVGDSSSSLLVVGSGFGPSLELIRCSVNSVVARPIIVNDTLVICSCPQSYETSSPQTFGLILEGGNAAFFSSPLQYYNNSLLLSSTTVTVPAGRSRQIEITGSLWPLWNSSSITCRVVSSFSLKIMESMGVAKYGGVHCEVTCSEQDIGATLTLQIETNGYIFNNINSFVCVEAPSIVSFSPESVVEGLDTIIDILVMSPIATASTVSCVFDGTHVAVGTVITKYYSAATTYLGLLCRAPPMLLGNASLVVMFDSIGSDSVLIGVFPYPEISKTTPSRIPSNVNAAVSISLSNSAIVTTQSSFSLTLDLHNQRSACSVEKTIIVCRWSPYTLKIGEHSLRLSMNSTLIGLVSVTVYDPIGILEVSICGAVIGTTSFVKVHLNSSSLSENNVIGCIFGINEYSGKMINSSAVLCQTPQIMNDSVTMLAVSIDGFSTEGVPFYFLSPVSDILVSPLFGTFNGGTNILFSSTGLVTMISYDCFFGSNKAAARYIGSNKFECVSPPGTLGKVELAIVVSGISARINKQDFIYEFIGDLVILEVSPMSFTAGSSLSVVTYGLNLLSPIFSQNIICLLGDYRLVAFPKSTNTLECVAPVLVDGRASLAVSLNGVDFYSSPTSALTYVSTPTLINLIPWHGPPAGGTQIYILGVGYLKEVPVLCKIDGNFSIPIQVNETVVTCLSIAANHGHLSEVSLFFSDIEASPLLYFSYDEVFIINGIEPTVISVSKNYSNYVHIFGESFYEYSDQKCRFGHQLTDLIWISSSELLCRIPIVVTPGLADVFISSNSFDYTFVGTVSVLAELLLYSLFPTSGPQSGFSNITLEGSAFNDNSNYICRFGELTVVATVVDVNHILCQSPPMLFVVGPVDVDVYAVDSGLTSSSLSFYYYSSPLITSASPQLGLSAGGTLVTFTFSALPKIPIILKCLFGDAPAFECYLLSGFDAQCITPSHVEGFVEISFSLNGVDFAASGIYFSFLPPIVINEILPSYVFVGKVSVLRIYGEFSAQLQWYCMMGTSVAPAMWETPSTLSCTVIAEYISVQAFALSPNRFDWSTGPSIDIIPLIEISSTDPKLIYFQGGSRILISGYTFHADHPYAIELVSSLNGVRKSPEIHYVNSTTLVFVMPSWVIPLNTSYDSLNLMLFSGSTIFENAALSLIIHGDIFLNSIEPTLIIYPGTLLNIVINSVPSGSIGVLEFALDFNANGHNDMNIVQSAFIVKGNSLIAPTPPFKNFTQNTTSITQIQVRLKLESGYTTNSLFVTLFNTKIISSNSQISEKGGDIILEVEFWPSSSSTLCQLGDTTVPSAYSSQNTRIICKFGTLAVGTYTLSISPNNGLEWLDSPYLVEVTSNLGVITAYPLLGPTSGLTNVSIVINSNLSKTTFPFCRFGNIEVPAVIIKRTIISCYSPAVPQSGNVSLGVVFRGSSGRLDANISSSFLFGFHEPIHLFSLSPNQGSMKGGTIIKISGSGFINTKYLIVKFSSPEDYSYLVNATWQSSNQISVASPENDIGIDDPFLDIRVSNNGIDYSSQSLSFYWDASVMYFGVSPSTILETGGYVIRVDGEGFSQSYPNSFRCRFGGVYTVEAFMTSNDQLRCIAPPMPPGIRNLDVSVNGDDYEYVGVIEYVPVPDLLSLAPASGSWRGGTNVSITLQGLNYLSTVYCIFDEQTVPASVMSSTTISCRAPVSSSSFQRTVEVSILLALGPMVTLNSDLNFTYIDDPLVASISVLSGPETGEVYMDISL